MPREDLIGSAEERISGETLALGKGGKYFLAGSDDLVEEGDIYWAWILSVTEEVNMTIDWSQMMFTVIAIVWLLSAAYRHRG